MSCVLALWLSSRVSVRAHQPIMFRNPDPFSATEIKDGLSERWIPSYNYTRIFLGKGKCRLYIFYVHDSLTVKDRFRLIRTSTLTSGQSKVSRCVLLIN